MFGLPNSESGYIMRLLDTYTGQFVEKDPQNSNTVFAILSHTWDPEGEQSFQELSEIQKRYISKSLPALSRAGSHQPEVLSRAVQFSPIAAWRPLKFPSNPPPSPACVSSLDVRSYSFLLKTILRLTFRRIMGT